MLGVIQGGFRRGRRTKDNVYMLVRIIEMSKGREDSLFVAFIDKEKAYDRVNRKKFFEVMRGYGINEMCESVIERVYEDNKFKLDSLEWCRCSSGVRHGCPLSPLLFVLVCNRAGHGS